MTPNYDRDGLRFCYPDNWSIVDEDFNDWPRTVSAQSPHTGVWIAHWYANAETPTELAGQSLQALRQEYEDVEAEVVSETIEDVDVIGYDISFCYLDLVAAGMIRAMQVGGHTLIVLCQAEDREFDELKPVFQAITISLLRASNLSEAS